MMKEEEEDGDLVFTQEFSKPQFLHDDLLGGCHNQVFRLTELNNDPDQDQNADANMDSLFTALGTDAAKF